MFTPKGPARVRIPSRSPRQETGGHVPGSSPAATQGAWAQGSRSEGEVGLGAGTPTWGSEHSSRITAVRALTDTEVTGAEVGHAVQEDARPSHDSRKPFLVLPLNPPFSHQQPTWCCPWGLQGLGSVPVTGVSHLSSLADDAAPVPCPAVCGSMQRTGLTYFLSVGPFHPCLL